MARQQRRRRGRQRKLYKPLGDGQIRLIKLLPSHDLATASRCYMITADIYDLDGTKYEAISYAWGDPSDTVALIVSGHALHITWNLHDALLAFRQTGEFSGYLWTDAVCIDQTNIAERGVQVARMDDIYARADRVVVWLGQAMHKTPDVLRLFQDCREGHKSYQEVCRTISTKPPLAFAFWRLADSPWWTRLCLDLAGVVQEIVLASHVDVYVGCHRISLQTLCAGLTSILSDYTPSESDGSWTNPTWSEWDVTERRRQVIQSIGASLQGKLDTQGNDGLIAWLLRLSWRQTSEPLDRVYAIMSLFPKQLGLIPDYSADVSRVYEQATAGVMRHMGTPAVIMMAGLQMYRRQGLASWVPDFGASVPWTPSMLENSIGVDYTHSLPEGLSFSYQREAHLSIWAFVADSIAGAGTPVPFSAVRDIASADTLHAIQSDLRVWWAFSRVKHSAAKEFWYDVGFSLPKHIAMHLHAGIDQAIQWLTRWLWMDGTSWWGTDIQNAIFLAVKGQCFFLTTRGRRGRVSHQAPHEGDLVAIVAQIPSPLILRRPPDTGPDVFELVRTCDYCQGMMQGEAVRGAASSLTGSENHVDRLFREIILV
ncbi:hypothetical protein LTR22_010230 [Elasticomyces elasticus]|nr:hypothetical protein LTR22_010230 [Elasticomyces elasticus]KAK4922079.1 hypothetical protein LTR49_010490 [Elasticomyces elasticus]KAK5750986.1 hypothetical protein LTS12_018976 [Elasticomyces elasticus]